MGTISRCVLSVQEFWHVHVLFCRPPVDMGMADPIPTFSYVVEQLAKKHPNLAYIHVVEPRFDGSKDREVNAGQVNISARA